MKTILAELSIAASYSTLSGAELLAKVVCQYKIDKPLSCLFWTQGVNDTYQVQCSSARYSLRVYRHARRCKDDIEFEIAALNYLRLQGAEVAYPIEKKGGGYITEVQAPEGLRYIILTTYAEGSVLNYTNPEDSRRFGESTAKLHNLSEDFTTTYKRNSLDINYLLDSSLDILRPHLTKRQADLAFVEQVAEEARSAVRSYPAEDLDNGFCHGDFHGGNVHQTNGVLTHFDFDECGFGLRIFDLATFDWNAKMDDKSEERWPHFIEGYKSVREFSDSELGLLNTFVLIRHFWWIGFSLENIGGFEHEAISENSINYYLDFLKKHTDNNSSKLIDKKPLRGRSTHLIF